MKVAQKEREERMSATRRSRHGTHEMHVTKVLLKPIAIKGYCS